jgi:hypothetical protein
VARDAERRRGVRVHWSLGAPLKTVMKPPEDLRKRLIKSLKTFEIGGIC